MKYVNIQNHFVLALRISAMIRFLQSREPTGETARILADLWEQYYIHTRAVQILPRSENTFIRMA